jgi:hypothetical protein
MIAGLLCFQAAFSQAANGRPWLFLPSLAAAGACLSVPSVLKRPGSPSLAANLLLGIGFLEIAAVNLVSGGAIPAMALLDTPLSSEQRVDWATGTLRSGRRSRQASPGADRSRRKRHQVHPDGRGHRPPPREKG